MDEEADKLSENVEKKLKAKTMGAYEVIAALNTFDQVMETDFVSVEEAHKSEYLNRIVEKRLTISNIALEANVMIEKLENADFDMPQLEVASLQYTWITDVQKVGSDNGDSVKEGVSGESGENSTGGSSGRKRQRSWLKEEWSISRGSNGEDGSGWKRVVGGPLIGEGMNGRIVEGRVGNAHGCRPTGEGDGGKGKPCLKRRSARTSSGQPASSVAASSPHELAYELEPDMHLNDFAGDW